MQYQNVTGAIVLLGCYLKRLSSNLGFNNSPTTVEMELVPGPGNSEDISLGATGFQQTNATPGRLLRINAGSLDFVGMIQSWTKNYGPNGLTYSVRIADPRSILDHIPVVIGWNVTDQAANAIPNVLDAFRYYGNPSGLGWTDNGTMWRNIKAFLENTTTTVDLYNNRFRFQFSSGFIEDSGNILTGIPSWYKIKGDILPFNEICGKVATDFGLDFYAYIDPTTFNSTSGSTNIIKIESIDRTLSNNSTEIDDFITNSIVSGTLIDYRRGQELRTDPNMIAVNGAPATMWIGANSAVGGSESIYSYWGLTADGSPLFSASVNTNRQGIVLLDNLQGSGLNGILANSIFHIPYTRYDLSKISGGIGYRPGLTLTQQPSYVTGYLPKETVLRAALYSQPSWEAMMMVDNPTEATLFGITTSPFTPFGAFSGIVNTSGEIALALRLSALNSAYFGERNPYVNARITTIYEATRAAAEEYYGKQYLVVMNGYSSDFNTNWITNNKFPQTLQFPQIEYSVVPAAWSQPLTAMPSGVTNHELLNISDHPAFRDERGKLKAFTSYVNFSSHSNTDFPYPIDMSVIPPNAFFIEQGEKLCLPVSVQQYEKYPLYALVNVPYSVQGVMATSGYDYQAAYYHFLLNMGYTKTYIDRYQLMSELGDNSEFGLAPPRPYYLKSAPGNYGIHFPVEFVNRNFGPWVASGSRYGAVNFIQESDLEPSQYGGYTGVESAGSGTATSALTSSDIIDSADLTIAGLPQYNLGANIGNNANISSISLQYGPDGLTTAYSIRTYSLPQQRLTKILFDKLTTIFNKTLYNTKETVRIDKRVTQSELDAFGGHIFKPSQINGGQKSQQSSNQNKGGGINIDTHIALVPVTDVSGNIRVY